MDMRVKWEGDKLLRELAGAIPDALQKAGDKLAEESNKDVPYKEGDLAGSADVAVEGNEAAVSYDSPYAVRQHEDLDAHHPNGRKAKYLERALDDNAQALLQEMADVLRKMLGGA